MRTQLSDISYLLDLVKYKSLVVERGRGVTLEWDGPRAELPQVMDGDEDFQRNVVGVDGTASDDR